jgi:nitrogen fixation-related uncharacterized protein
LIREGEKDAHVIVHDSDQFANDLKKAIHEILRDVSDIGTAKPGSSNKQHSQEMSDKMIKDGEKEAKIIVHDSEKFFHDVHKAIHDILRDFQRIGKPKPGAPIRKH